MDRFASDTDIVRGISSRRTRIKDLFSHSYDRPRYCRTATLLIAAAAFATIAFFGCYPKPVGPKDPEGKRPTWAEMNFEQRKAHMRKVVLPQAADVFGAWRPERFAQVDCTLCHGQGANIGMFDMPTSHLPRLSGDLLLGPEFKKYPGTTRLKLDRLVPTMAEALGLKTFSIITRRGFGCYSCHLGPSGAMFGN